jgi:hypothetical protein
MAFYLSEVGMSNLDVNLGAGVIVVSHEQSDAQEFVAWLKQHSYSASVGSDDANYIDGHCTLASPKAYTVFKELYGLYWRDRS